MKSPSPPARSATSFYAPSRRACRSLKRTKSAYVCSDCGATALQWFGSCPSCGAPGTLTETASERGAVKRISGAAPGAVALQDVETRELERLSTGIGEL